MSSNLARLVTEAAERHGDRPALKLDDAVLTYAMLDGATAHIAGLLKAKGVQPGDRVGIMLPNVPYFGALYYGILKAGGVVVPMNVLFKGREVSFYLSDSGARLIFAWHGFEEAAREGAEAAGAELVSVKPGEFEAMVGAAQPDPEVADRDGSDTAVILYTSGTTGTPKGAELTHDNLYRNCEVSDPHAVRRLGARRPARGAAAVPHLRPDLRPERGDEGRRVPHHGPALRRGQGARDHPARPGHDLRGRADDVPRAPQPPRARALRRLLPPPVRVGRGRPAGGDHARVRGGLLGQDHRGLRPLGDLAGRLLQPSRQGAQAGLDRHADRGGGDEGGRRRAQRRGAGRGGRDRHPRPQHHEGLLEPAGRDRGGHEGRLVPLGRHGAGWTRTATTSSSTARRT